MNNDESSPFAAAPSGRRFQFSLATLMVVATVVSVLCSLAVWLGPSCIVALILAGGPIGGAIIVRIRKSKVGGEIALWSGVVTIVLWGSILVYDGILRALSDPNGGRVLIGDVAAAVFFVVLFGLSVGISTGIAWEVGAYVLRKCWQLVCRGVRVRSGPKD